MSQQALFCFSLVLSIHTKYESQSTLLMMVRRAGLSRYCWWWWWQCWWWRRPPTHSHSDTGKSMAMDFWQAAHPPPLPSPAATPIFNRQHSLQLSPLWWPLFTKHTLHHPVHPPPWNQLQTTLMASCRLEASVCQSGKSTLATTIVTTVASWTSLEKKLLSSTNVCVQPTVH